MSLSREGQDLVKRVVAAYEAARAYAFAHEDAVEESFIAATELPQDVVKKQLRERTDLSNGKIGNAFVLEVCDGRVKAWSNTVISS